MLLSIKDVDFKTEMDLVAKYASRPIHKPSTLYNINYNLRERPNNKYNVDYDHDITPTTANVPCPARPMLRVDLVRGDNMVYGTNLGTPRLNWTAAHSSLQFGSNYPSTTCAWFIDNGSDMYWVAPYGLLPSYLHSNNFEIVRVNELYAYVDPNTTAHILFSDDGTNGLTPVASMVGLEDTVYFDVDVYNKTNDSTINVTGHSIDGYVRTNSPYGGAMALYVPYTDTYSAKGDMKGELRMVETPWT